MNGQSYAEVPGGVPGGAHGGVPGGVPRGAHGPVDPAPVIAPGAVDELRSVEAWITPDAVALDVDVATIGSRGIAYLLDLGIVLSALLVIQLAQLLLGWGGFVAGWLPIAILLVAAFALQFGYPIGFEVLWRGRTLGKAAMGLRVVTVEGAPVGFRHAAIRAVAGVFELLSTLGILAIISSFSSERGQRLGDLAAGTVVIRERRARQPVRAMHYPIPPGWEHHVRLLDVAALGSHDRAVIRDTLRRADTLEPTVREQLMTEVADAIVDRVSPEPPEGADAELYLRCVAARLAERGSSLGTPGLRTRGPDGWAAT